MNLRHPRVVARGGSTMDAANDAVTVLQFRWERVTRPIQRGRAVAKKGEN